MDTKPMSPEEDYRFDVAGYLILRGVLTEAELSTCNQALDEGSGSEGMLEWPEPLCDPFVKLCDHSLIAQYLKQLCWDEYRHDQPPRLIDETVCTTSEPLIGGNEPRRWSRAYQQRNHTRYCHGVLAVWALTDVGKGEGGFVLVPGSHRSDLETPDDLLDGTDEMGLVEQPVLEAGDLLLCAQNVLHGFRPWKGVRKVRLLTYGYISGLVRRSDGSVQEGGPASWEEEMTPEQRAVLSATESISSVVKSDGQTCHVERTDAPHHPSIHVRDPNSNIDEKEFYFWDLCGYAILKDVMDDAWITAAHEAIDQFRDRFELDPDGTNGSRRLAGTPFPSLHGLFDLPHPYCEPFREMIAHPVVVQRLNWMMGSGYYLSRARAIHYERGTSGLHIHSTPEPATPRNTYALQNGRAYSEQVNVNWQLVDTRQGDGGFVCVPGSHKANYPVPEALTLCEEEMGMVKHVEIKAGDVLIFMGASQSHGAYPWMNETPRRGVIITYKSRNLDLTFEQ